MGHNMDKSSSPNVPSIGLIFLRRCSCFRIELASILLLAFSLFKLVATLSYCLCSESPYLSIKFYSIYVCSMNITLYSVWYYPWFHVTTVVLGMYYPWIWGHSWNLFHASSWQISIRLVTGLWAGLSRTRTLTAKDFSLLQNIHISSGAQPASY
jgi:hypothetical protein